LPPLVVTVPLPVFSEYECTSEPGGGLWAVVVELGSFALDGCEDCTDVVLCWQDVVAVDVEPEGHWVIWIVGGLDPEPPPPARAVALAVHNPISAARNVSG
jgi:hypothetical protein